MEETLRGVRIPTVELEAIDDIGLGGTSLQTGSCQLKSRAQLRGEFSDESVDPAPAVAALRESTIGADRLLDALQAAGIEVLNVGGDRGATDAGTPGELGVADAAAAESFVAERPKDGRESGRLALPGAMRQAVGGRGLENLVAGPQGGQAEQGSLLVPAFDQTGERLEVLLLALRLAWVY